MAPPRLQVIGLIALGIIRFVATFVIADLLFVAFAIWRYRSAKSTRPPMPPAAVAAERIAA